MRLCLGLRFADLREYFWFQNSAIFLVSHSVGPHFRLSQIKNASHSTKSGKFAVLELKSPNSKTCLESRQN